MAQKTDYSISRLTERELITAMLFYSDDTIIVKSLEGIILTWNAGAERMYGYKPDEVIGQPIAILVPPELPNEVPDILSRLRRGEKIDHYEAVRVHKDGHRLDVSLSVTPIKDDDGQIVAALKVARDITIQKRAQRRAEQLQRITAALSEAVTVEQVADVIVRHDFVSLGVRLGVIALVEDEQSTLRILAQYGLDVARPGLNPTISCDQTSIFAEPVQTGGPLWITDYGEWIETHDRDADFWPRERCRALASLPMVVEDRVIGVMCFGFPDRHLFDADERDYLGALTLQCAQALERAQLFDAERRARQAAQKADELTLKFLAMISHELRTPLTSIKGFTSTLLSTDVKWDVQNQYEFIRIIDDEADKLTRLIDELLDLSRLQAGKLRIALDYAYLPMIVEQAQPELEALAREHRLDIRLPEDLPLIHVDARRIAQVLTNLVSNAAKYSEPDSWIRILARFDGSVIRVDVSDEGIGVEPEASEIIFEAFQQGHEALKGAGLGLAICRGLIEAHGGQIWVEDRPGPGSTFSFTLPVARA